MLLLESILITNVSEHAENQKSQKKDRHLLHLIEGKLPLNVCTSYNPNERVMCATRELDSKEHIGTDACHRTLLYISKCAAFRTTVYLLSCFLQKYINF